MFCIKYRLDSMLTDLIQQNYMPVRIEFCIDDNSWNRELAVAF